MAGKKRRAERERLLTTSDLAEYLNVCEHTIYRWCKTGKVPHFNLNKTFRFDPTEIRQWLAASRGGQEKEKSKKGEAA